MDRYRGSDGRHYADSEIWERLEAGDWAVCCWDVETRLQVVETAEQDLMFLWPVDTEAVIGEVTEEHA